MPTSLIVVALVVAWLVVLVPMIVRKRQEIARTADTELAARVVRAGSAHDSTREEFAMHEPAETQADAEPVRDATVPAATQDHEVTAAVEYSEEYDDEYTDDAPASYDDGERPRYRPGRGGFDPEAAALAAKAKYGFRQRVVVALLLLTIITIVLAAVVNPTLWWVNGAADLSLLGYLGYLRRQVRIEEEIRQRRLARMGSVRRSHAHPRPAQDEAEDDRRGTAPARARAPQPAAAQGDPPRRDCGRPG